MRYPTHSELEKLESTRGDPLLHDALAFTFAFMEWLETDASWEVRDDPGFKDLLAAFRRWEAHR